MNYFLILAIACFTAAAQAQVSNEPTLRAAYFERIYVPGGYDSNDHIQIVGEGTFNNSCFRFAESHVAIDEGTKQIHLGAVAYEYGGICLQVMLPFQRTMDLGILKAGKWSVEQDGKVIAQLNVRPATTPEADDYLYAPVSQAFFSQTGKVSKIVLTGSFTNSCLEMDHVKVKVEPHVIVIQPIAKLLNRGDCHAGEFPFTNSATVADIQRGRYLLHVRSLNGNSVNSLVDVY